MRTLYVMLSCCHTTANITRHHVAEMSCWHNMVRDITPAFNTNMPLIILLFATFAISLIFDAPFTLFSRYYDMPCHYRCFSFSPLMPLTTRATPLHAACYAIDADFAFFYLIIFCLCCYFVFFRHAIDAYAALMLPCLLR